MRYQHILGAALIAALAFPLFAADLYVSQVRGCGLIVLCTPGLGFYRVDLERQEVTPLRDALSGYTTLAGFDAMRPRVFVRVPVESAFCCRAMWVDLTPNPSIPYGLYPFSSFSSVVYDSGRLLEIRGPDLVELDLVTGAPSPVLSIGMIAETLALDAVHGRLYIAVRPGSSQARDLRVVDLARKTVSGPLMQIRQFAAVVTDRDGTAYIFDGQRFVVGLTDVSRLDAATNELTSFAREVLIETDHLVIDPVDRRVYGTYAGEIVAFDLITKTTTVAVPRPIAGSWGPVAGVVHKAPARTRAIR